MSNQNRSRGSAKYSRLRLTCNSNKDSKINSNNVESISKYFIKTSHENNEPPEQDPIETFNFSEHITPLPVTEIKSIIINDDENDFKSPVPVKIAKIFQNTQNKSVKPKKLEAKRKYNTRKSKAASTMIQRTIEDNFKNSSVNGDSLQMAIALSKSEDDARNPSQSDEDVDVLAPIYPCTQKIQENSRRFLEQFGFVSSKNHKDVANIKNHIELSKRKKKSKFHYITPPLKLRTTEDRECLINEKVFDILQSSREFLDNRKPFLKTSLEPSSELLKQQYTGNKIFKINNLQDSELTIDTFYVSDLNLPKSSFKCGSLLKRWEDIPGRDLSPIKCDKISDLENPLSEMVKCNNSTSENIELQSEHNCSGTDLLDPINVSTPIIKTATYIRSPDLFDSDEDGNNFVDSNILPTICESNESVPKNDLSVQSQDIEDLKESSVNVESLIKILAKGDEPEIVNLDTGSQIPLTDELSKVISPISKTDLNLESPLIASGYRLKRGWRMTSQKNLAKTVLDANFEAKKMDESSLTQSACHIISNFGVPDAVSPIISIPMGDTSFTKDIENLKLKPVGIDIMSASLLSNLYENKSIIEKDQFHNDSYIDSTGICHFESFREPEETLCELQKTVHAEDNDFIVGGRNVSEYNSYTSMNVTEYVKNVLNEKYASDSSDDGIVNLSQNNANFRRNYSLNNITRVSSSSESDEEDDLQLTINSRILKHDLIHHESPEKIAINTKMSPEIIAISDGEEDIVVTQVKKTEFKKYTSNASIESNVSQESICISDEELNYSSYGHKHEEINNSLENICVRDEELNYSIHGPKHEEVNNSQESISITDEELNYSSYGHEHEAVKTNEENLCIRDEELNYSIHGHKHEKVNNSQESISISDEELNYSSYGHKHEEVKTKQENLCIRDEELNHSNSSVHKHEERDNSNELVENWNNFDANEMSISSILKQFGIKNSLQETDNVPECSTSYHEDLQLDENTIKSCKEDNIIHATTPKSSFNKPEIGLPTLDDTFPSFSHIDLLECEKVKTPTNTILHPRISALVDKKSTPSKIDLLKSQEDSRGTPKHYKSASSPDDAMIIKTDNVTPMANYDDMNTPKIVKELEKYGLKALKRRRGVELLKYIYDATHPVLGSNNNKINDDDEDLQVIKRRKKCDKNKEISPQSNFTVTQDFTQISIVGDINESGDYIFERKQSKKIHSCRLPLHIAWHNFISCNRQLQENILLYEPLQVEVLYSMFKAEGFKYHIQDLITFLDKKCITIRIKQGK